MNVGLEIRLQLAVLFADAFAQVLKFLQASTATAT